MNTSTATNPYEEAVMAAIPGASVSACLKDNQLYLTAVFENRQLWSPYQRVCAALTNAGLDETFWRLHFDWFSDKQERAVAVVKKAVADVLLRPRNQREWAEYSIRVSWSEEKLRIDILRLQGFSASQASEEIWALREWLLARVESRDLSLNVEGYAPARFSYNSSILSGGSSDDYDCDDYDANPNWPSRTGNPSGRGRGNN